MQSRDKDTLPRFISLPLALFLWILLGLLLIVGMLAWYEQVPTYVPGKGVVLSSKYVPRYAHQGAVAAVFFTADQANNLHVGQSVFVYFGTSTQAIKETVLAVDPVVSPSDAQRRYGLGSEDAFLITQPSVVVIIGLEKMSPSQYAGSMLTASVQVGLRRVISLLPGIGSLLGK